MKKLLSVILTLCLIAGIVLAAVLISSADEIEELLYEPEELMNYADVLEYEGLYF